MLALMGTMFCRSLSAENWVAVKIPLGNVFIMILMPFTEIFSRC